MRSNVSTSMRIVARHVLLVPGRRWLSLLLDALQRLEELLGPALLLVILPRLVIQVARARDIRILKAVGPSAELARDAQGQLDQFCEFAFQMRHRGMTVTKSK